MIFNFVFDIRVIGRKRLGDLHIRRLLASSTTNYEYQYLFELNATDEVPAFVDLRSKEIPKHKAKGYTGLSDGRYVCMGNPTVPKAGEEV